MQTQVHEELRIPLVVTPHLSDVALERICLWRGKQVLKGAVADAPFSTVVVGGVDPACCYRS